MRRLISIPSVAGLLCLGIIVFFHSPHWWLFTEVRPGSLEWTRAISYLQQCAAPFSDTVEPAMRWRFFPQLFIWFLGGNSLLALLFPWLGAWCFLSYINFLAKSHGHDPRTAMAMTLALGATAPVLTSTGWLGFNDAWVALGLSYLAFGQRTAWLVVICIICPFIDERFIFGIPSALVLRNLDTLLEDQRKGFVQIIRQSICALAPFLLVRSTGHWIAPANRDQSQFLWHFIFESPAYLWMAPMGAWMALRLAIFPAAQGIWKLFQRHRIAAGLLFSAAIAPVLLGYLLASDTARTTGILLPVCIWAVVESRKEQKGKWIWYALAMLLIPAAHVTHTKIAPISSFPIELIRLLR